MFRIALLLASAGCWLGPLAAAEPTPLALEQPVRELQLARDAVPTAPDRCRQPVLSGAARGGADFDVSSACREPAPAAPAPFRVSAVANDSAATGATDTEPQRSVMTEFRSDPISPALIAKLTALDADRIKRFDESRKVARREAGAGDAKALAALTDLMDAQPLGIEPKALVGKWRCRVFNLGGDFSPIYVNPSFNCRISLQGDDYVFEKISGSHLMLGKLERVDAHRLIYYGAYYSSPPKPAYPPTDSYHDEVGFLFRLGPTRLRLELPLPTAWANSHHDVIELTR